MYPCLRHYHAISIIPRWTNFSSAFSFLLFLFSFFLSFFLSSFLSLHPIERKKGILRASAVVSTVLSSASPYSRHGLLTESGSRHCFNHRESPEHNSAPLYYIQPRSFIQLFLPLRRSFFFFLPPLFVVFSFFFKQQVAWDSQFQWQFSTLVGKSLDTIADDWVKLKLASKRSKYKTLKNFDF